jgi:hypothetical protein
MSKTWFIAKDHRWQRFLKKLGFGHLKKQRII